MNRKIAAVLAFNAYAFIFVQSFSAATPLLFHSHELANLRNQGISINPQDWGFDDNYIWRAIAAVISTAMAAFICGAIARTGGGKLALLANLPSVAGWIAYAWILFSAIAGGNDEGMKIAYGAVSIAAVPGTSWIALKFGEIGQQVQTQLPRQDRTLGLSDWHWAWLWLPIAWYGFKIVTVIVAYLVILLKLGTRPSVRSFVLSPLGLILMVSWILPLVVSYRLLVGARFTALPQIQRGAIVVAVLVGGYALASAVWISFGFALRKLGV